MARAKANTKPDAKAKSDLDQIRDSLPFFKKMTRTESASWWHVKPTGDYLTDRETGAQYARQFLPMLGYVGGPPALCWIVDAIARNAPRTSRLKTIDNIAVGFVAELASNLQQAMGAIAAARLIGDEVSSPLAEDFKGRVDNGTVLDPPPFAITSAEAPTGRVTVWHGQAIQRGAKPNVFEWIYEPADHGIRVKVQRVGEPDVWRQTDVPPALSAEIQRTVQTMMEARQ